MAKIKKKKTRLRVGPVLIVIILLSFLGCGIYYLLGMKIENIIILGNEHVSDEKIIEEDNHIYEIIVAEPSVVPFRYSKYELDFGPFLLENKGPVFRKKWQEYLQREAHVIDQMQKAQQPPVKKINEINEFLSQVKEAIADDNR